MKVFGVTDRVSDVDGFCWITPDALMRLAVLSWITGLLKALARIPAEFCSAFRVPLCESS